MSSTENDSPRPEITTSLDFDAFVDFPFAVLVAMIVPSVCNERDPTSV